MPADGRVTALLRGLDGERAQRTVLADAAREGLDPATVTGLLDGLRAAGLVVDLDAADLLAADAGPRPPNAPPPSGSALADRPARRRAAWSSSRARPGSAPRWPPCWPRAGWGG